MKGLVALDYRIGLFKPAQRGYPDAVVKTLTPRSAQKPVLAALATAEIDAQGRIATPLLAAVSLTAALKKQGVMDADSAAAHSRRVAAAPAVDYTCSPTRRYAGWTCSRWLQASQSAGRHAAGA